MRRLVGVFLVLVWLAAAAWAEVTAAEFTDVKKSHWAYPAIEEVVDKYHIMSGFPDRTFQGAKTLSRYELAAALTKVVAVIESEKHVDLKSPAESPQTFTDVPAGHWAAGAVNSVANEYGLVQGFPDKTFQGVRITTRYEIAAILHKLGQRLEERIAPYAGEIGSDYDKFIDLVDKHWANAAIKAVVDRYGILQGFPGHTFQGGRKLTRYEFASTLSRLLKFAFGLEKPPPPTPPPTPVPTPQPTPQPVRVKPLPLLRLIDLKGNFLGGASSSFGSPYQTLWGAYMNASGWFPGEWARWGPGHFGVGGYATATYGQATTYVLTGVVAPPPSSGAGAILAPVNYYQYNVLGGVQAKYRLDMSKAIGTTAEESELNPSLIFSLGYSFIYMRNPLVPYLGHGVTAGIEGEYPVAWATGSTTFGFYGGVDYAYYFPENQKNYNYLNGTVPHTLAYGAGVEFGGFNWETGEISFRVGFQGYTVFQNVLGANNRRFQLNGGHVGVRLRI